MTDDLLALLLEVAVKGSFVLAAAWLVTTVMARRSAAERHLIWVLAVIGVLALPLFSATAPRLELPAAESALVSSVVTALQRDPQARPAALATVPQRTAAADDTAAPSGTPLVNDAPAPSAGVRIDFATAIVAVWLAGVLALLLRAAVAAARIGAHVRALDPLDAVATRALVESLRAELGIRRAIGVRGSAQDSSPWTWGVLRPVLVLPAAFETWSEAARRRVLVHELAHVRRLDHLSGTLVQLCCAAHWFNPLVWLAARRVRLESEQACDDRVVCDGDCAPAYAEQLVRIANDVFAENGRSVWIPAMAHRSSLSPRVRSILDPNKRRTAVSKFNASLAVLAGLALVVPLAALQSQEPESTLSDAEFLRIERDGPAGSGELEQLVDAYVANGRQDDAADALARFMIGEYGSADEHGCDFCAQVLATEGARRRHAHFPVMIAALDRIEQRAETERSGDVLLQAVLDNTAGSRSARGMSRTTYYVMRAIQIGIEDDSALEVVDYLYEQGSLAEAKDLATRLFDNEASPHYRSEAARQWIVFLESELARRASVARIIFDSLGVNDDEILDEEYVPIAKIPPVYPKEAAAAGVEGTVVVEFTVNTKGRPEGVTVVSSTNNVFDSSAVEAAREFRYAPRVVAGTPVAVTGVRNKIAFVLER